MKKIIRLTEQDLKSIVKRVLQEQDNEEDRKKSWKERQEIRKAEKKIRELPTVTVKGKKLDPTQGVKLKVFKNTFRTSLLRNIIAKNMVNFGNGVKFDWSDGKDSGTGMFYCGTNKVDTLGPIGYLSKKGSEVMSTFCDTYASNNDVDIVNDYV